MFRIGIVQNNPHFLKVRKNIAEVLELMEESQADLWVLPELFASGYNFKTREEVFSVAENIPNGITCEILGKWAEKNHCAVVAGLPEKLGKRLYNSAVLIDRNSVHLYRKTHLFGEEKKFFAQGNTGFWTRSVKGVKIGVMICFDWFFPESCRTLALQGAQIIAHSANLVLPWGPDGMKIRSLENRVFTVTANRVGHERGLRYIGASQVINPSGEILFRMSGKSVEASIIAVNPNHALNKKINKKNDLFEDRRPEFYHV